MSIECPYCDKENEPPDDCHEQDVTYEADCSACGKYFSATVSYIAYWTGKKAPCMNGGPHVWKKQKGFPVNYYKHRKFCIHCDEFNNDPNVSATK